MCVRCCYSTLPWLSHWLVMLLSLLMDLRLGLYDSVEMPPWLLLVGVPGMVSWLGVIVSLPPMIDTVHVQANPGIT